MSFTQYSHATFLAVGLALVAGQGTRASGRKQRYEESYLTKPAALLEAFPDAEKVERTRIVLKPEEKQRIEKRLRRRLFERDFVVFRGLKADGTLCGHAIIAEEIGKFQPITFIVACTPEMRVKRVAVMVYRETVGNEVRRRRFLSQFVGRTLQDRLRLNREVVNVAGATYSCRAIARGVKKVLHTIDELVVGTKRRRELDWSAVKLEKERRKLSSREPRRGMRYLMGTLFEITCYGEQRRVAAARRDAFDEVARLEDLLSSYRAHSEISRVNREAMHGPVRISPDTFACLEAALVLARRTGGAFDPTLVRNGYKAVELDREARTVRFLRLGLHLDLGGIGKGFALDRARKILERHGVNRALLDFGGQVLALDAPPGASGWIVMVQDPEEPGGFLGYYDAVRVSISTSASYERGRHIVDPRRGTAADSVLSATVCSASATAADALSTALNVLGAGAVDALHSGLDGGAVLVVPAGGGELVSRGAPVLRRTSRPFQETER